MYCMRACLQKQALSLLPVGSVLASTVQLGSAWVRFDGALLTEALLIEGAPPLHLAPARRPPPCSGRSIPLPLRLSHRRAPPFHSCGRLRLRRLRPVPLRSPALPAARGASAAAQPVSQRWCGAPQRTPHAAVHSGYGVLPLRRLGGRRAGGGGGRSGPFGFAAAADGGVLGGPEQESESESGLHPAGDGSLRLPRPRARRPHSAAFTPAAAGSRPRREAAAGGQQAAVGGRSRRHCVHCRRIHSLRRPASVRAASFRYELCRLLPRHRASGALSARRRICVRLTDGEHRHHRVGASAATRRAGRRSAGSHHHGGRLPSPGGDRGRGHLFPGAAQSAARSPDSALGAGRNLLQRIWAAQPQRSKPTAG